MPRLGPGNASFCPGVPHVVRPGLCWRTHACCCPLRSIPSCLLFGIQRTSRRRCHRPCLATAPPCGPGGGDEVDYIVKHGRYMPEGMVRRDETRRKGSGSPRPAGCQIPNGLGGEENLPLEDSPPIRSVVCGYDLVPDFLDREWRHTTCSAGRARRILPVPRHSCLPREFRLRALGLPHEHHVFLRRAPHFSDAWGSAARSGVRLNPRAHPEEFEGAPDARCPVSLLGRATSKPCRETVKTCGVVGGIGQTGLTPIIERSL